MNWKALAIIFLILFIVETAFVVWSIYYTMREDAKLGDCYYNFCQGSYDAKYTGGVCTCYDLDMMGNYVVNKTKYG